MSARIAQRLFCAILLLLAGAISPLYADSLERGPYLQMGTPESITIRWRTDVASASSVQYGNDLGTFPQNTVTDPAITTEHEVTLSGLSPDSLYYYAVLDSSGAVLSGEDNAHFFITAPPVGMNNTTRAWIIGDSGTANANAAAVYSAFQSRAGPDYTDLWIMLGDNAYNDGTDTEYQAAVFDMYPELLKQSPLWATLGNHDGHTADSASQSGPYYDIFTLPTNGEAGGVPSGTEAYYSFDYGQIHFICLDSYETNREPGSAMMTWLESDLQATNRKWIVAFWHHPPYTKGSHNSDSESALIDMRENALPILESYGVDLVLSGHSHSYERSYLLDSHYGLSTTLDPATMIVDGGNGDPDSDGGYLKNDLIKDPNLGAVYVVAGSSGKTSGGSLDHPAMFASINTLGSMLLEVTSSEMRAIFIDQNNTIRDSFSIIKGEDTLAPSIVASQAVSDTTVDVTFSERLDAISAENIGNYAVDQGVAVSGASLSADKRTVTLTTSTLAPAVNYTLTVNNVTDEAANVIAVDSQTAFTFVNLITLEFQNGALPDSGYAGAEDAYLAQVNPDTNYGASSSLFLDGYDGGNDLSSLLRWDISAIPSDAIIESVSINIEVFNPSGSSYSLYELNRAWVENEVTWNQYASAGSWQTAGALGASDRESTVLATLSPASGSHTIHLNNDGIALVQSWVDGSSINHGVIAGDTDSTDGVDFYSSETSTIANRPKLTVVYSLPVSSGDTEPPTIPSNLHTTAIGTDTVSLAWDASTDNVAVAGYKVFRDGAMVGDVSSNSFSDSSLSPATAYSYEVSAYDAANNTSALSPALAVTTEAITAEMHVADISMSTVAAGKRKIRARADIAVVDQDGSPLSGVTVSVAWSGLVNQSVTDITGSDGRIIFDSATVNINQYGEFTATVTNISAAGYNYIPGSNVETSDCITSDSLPCDASPITMSADAVSVSLKKKGSRYDATAIVSVIDASDGSPVSGASVTGSWSITGAAAGSGQGSTAADGEALIKKSKISAVSGDVILFTVTHIERNGDIFDGGQTSGSATVQ